MPGVKRSLEFTTCTILPGTVQLHQGKKNRVSLMVLVSTKKLIEFENQVSIVTGGAL